MSDKTLKTKMPRRKFLELTAAAGAGISLVNVSKGLAQTNNSNDLKVAILGCGSEGQVLMDAALRIPNVRFTAVCDIWEKWNLKRTWGILRKFGHQANRYIDYKEMLAKEKDLDAILIATPDFWHAEHAIACLNAGLDVYCEKEMSNTLESARKMVEAQKRTGKLLQIGHQRRSNPRYIYSYDKIVKNGILGRITSMNGQWNRSVQPDLGWPKKYAIDAATLKKFGFKNMHQFRNWRWYKGLGGGPIVDLGSHQIDIFAWFAEANPSAVMASGGTDYFDKATHEWYDTVMAIYEYETPAGTVRARYQTLTTNSSEGYFENFLGDQGTLQISESGGRGGVYREANNPATPDWGKWVSMGILEAPEEEEGTKDAKAVLDVRETVAPPVNKLPVSLNDPYHQPHLENFFNAVRGIGTLNCPAEIGYETAVAVLKVNEAIEAGKKLTFKPEEFHV